MRRWSIGLLATALAVPLLLAGCAEKHQASQSLPTASTTTAAKTLPPLGPADLPMPQGARQRNAQGFQEFTKYYVSLVNRLSIDLDGQYLRQFSRNCETCERLAGDATQDAAKGYHYVGGKMQIVAEAPAHLTDAGAETAFTIDQEGYSVVDSQGNGVPGLSSAPLTNVTAGAVGVWNKDHWLMTTLSFG